MRNTAQNVDEVFELAQLALNTNTFVFSVTNNADVVPYLDAELKPYWVPAKRHYQFETTKLVPGVFLWVTYAPKQNIPIVAYGFNPYKLHSELENSLCHLPNQEKHLQSHVAIPMLRKAGAKKIFLATPNMHPLPDSNKLDEIFAHHYYENQPHVLDGLETYGTNFKASDILFFHDYAYYNHCEVSGGDNYCCQYPTSLFGKIKIPESPQSIWIKEL